MCVALMHRARQVVKGLLVPRVLWMFLALLSNSMSVRRSRVKFEKNALQNHFVLTNVP